jgi:LysM repeat protein
VAALNPELRRNRVPPDMLPYPVRIPDGSGEAFEKGWPQVAAKIDPLDTYEVKFGDTLTRIAHVFGTTVAEVAEVNDIEKKDEIAAGDVILVPHGVVPAELPEEPPTIGVPAVKFVYPGHRRVFYEIIPGDNLSVVGAYFGVTVADLCTWNELDPSAHIHPGMWLQIFVPEDEDLAKAVILEQDEVVIHEVGSEEFLDWQAEQAGKDRIVYTVSEGETLKSIAEKFDVKVSSIVRINQFGYGTDLAPGQDIVLYVDQDSSDNPPQ